MQDTTPVALSIAGSDCSAGAGIQADLKTFSTFGIYGLTAVTSVVAEVPGEVVSIHPVPGQVIFDQIRILGNTYPIAAIKTGMLGNAAAAEAVCKALGNRTLFPSLPPVVVDPVMAASSGDSLINHDALEILKNELLPMARVFTPNLDEAAVLLEPHSLVIDSEEAMGEAVRRLAEKFGVSVLLKGGHLPLENGAVDLLWDGESLDRFDAERIPDAGTHGSGCTLSAAITACLALGLPLVQAVATAKDFLTEAIRSRYVWELPGRRRGKVPEIVEALDHFA